MNGKWATVLALAGFIGLPLLPACSGYGSVAKNPSILPAIDADSPSYVSLYLYVANSPKGAHGWISVYSTPNMTLVRKITAGVDHPGMVALDERGNLYVFNQRGNAGVVEYAAGSSTILRSIPRGSKRAGIGGIAVDPQGDIFALVASGQVRSHVDVYGPTGTTPVRRITDGMSKAHLLAVDTAGFLYVSDLECCHPSELFVYAPGSSTYLNSVEQGNAVSIAFDRSNNIYAAMGSSEDRYGNEVFIAAQGLHRPTRQIDYPHGPSIVAVTPAGLLNVQDNRGISIFPPGSRKPAAIIAGVFPRAMACGPKGDLYAAMGPEVDVYASGTNKLLQSVKTGVAGAVALTFGTH